MKFLPVIIITLLLLSTATAQFEDFTNKLADKAAPTEIQQDSQPAQEWDFTDKLADTPSDDISSFTDSLADKQLNDAFTEGLSNTEGTSLDFLAEELKDKGPTQIALSTPKKFLKLNEIVQPVMPIDKKVRDSKGRKVEADITFARDNVTISFLDSPIKEMTLYKMDRTTDLPRVDDVPTTVPTPVNGRWTQIYAIDPTNTEFTTGTVKVTATGKQLYKCKDWRFDQQTCTGTWQLIGNVIPGKTYYLQIDALDPAFGEINATAAIHVDENKTFISDIFDYVKFIDGNWSETIPENHSVQVTFEQNLDDGNVIDFIARDNGTESYVSVYITNTTTLVGRSGTATLGEMQYITLENVPYPTNIFDLRVNKRLHNLAEELPCSAENPGCADASIAENARVGMLEFDYIHDQAITNIGADGIAVYSESGVSGARYRNYNQTNQSLGNERTTTVSPGAQDDFIKVVSNHERDETILAEQDESTNVTAQVWNGTAWGNIKNISSNTVSTIKQGFDVAIEDISGDAIVFSANSTVAAPIVFNIWNGTAWSGQFSYNRSPSVAIHWVKAVARPNSDEIMLLTLDANSDLVGILWNGNNFTFTTEQLITASINDFAEKDFDFQWEAISGDGVVFYGNSSTIVAKREFNSTTKAWHTDTILLTLNGGIINGLTTCRDPTSNRIGLMTQDSTNDFNAVIWNGVDDETSPAAPAEEATGEANSAPAINVGCAFTSLNGTGLFGFSIDLASAERNVLLCTYNRTNWKTGLTGCGQNTALNISLSTDNVSVEQLLFYPNPVTNEVAIFGQNLNEDFNFALWNGSRLINTTNVTLESTLDCLDGIGDCGGFDWVRYDPMPNATIMFPSNGTVFNQSQSVNITLNTTDNILLGIVNITILDPDGVSSTFNMTRYSGTNISGLYHFVFNTTTKGGRYLFDIRSFDNSTHNNSLLVQGTFNIFCAGNITQNTTMIANATCRDDGTEIGADNITLDCNGYTVIWNNNGGDNEYGITATNRKNVTIKNCILLDGNGATRFSRGIFFTRTNQSNITNNTIQTNGQDSNVALYFLASEKDEISGNVLRTQGTADSNVGIFGQDSSVTELTIINNTIFTTGTTDNYGILGPLANSDHLIAYNYIATNGSSTDNDAIVNVGRARIISNFINTDGSGRNVGIFSAIGIIDNNTIVTDGASNNHGMVIDNRNVNITNNRIIARGTAGNIFGINFTGVSSVRDQVVNNTILVTGTIQLAGFYAQGTTANLNFSNNNITINTTSAATGNSFGIFLNSTNGNNTFNNTNITMMNQTAFIGSSAIYFSSSNGNSFYNTLINSTKDWIALSNGAANNNFTNTTFLNSNGAIRFYGQVNLTGGQNVTRTKINTSANRAFVNSTNLTNFNTTAQITLPGLSFTDPEVTVDFEDDVTFTDCSPTICTEDSYAGGVFTFNVTRWTAYSSQEFSLCGDTIIVDTTLNQDYNCTGRFLTLGVDTIFLDCNGHTVNWDTGGTGAAAIDFLGDGTYVRNCILKDGSNTGTGGVGINLSNVNTATVYNNSILTNGTTNNNGITITDGGGHFIENNTINTTPIGNNNGIYIFSGTTTSQHRISKNLIITNGSGINLEEASLNIISNNFIYGNGTGLLITGTNSEDNNISYNNITQYVGTGINTTGRSTGSQFLNNNITLFGTAATNNTGIYVNRIQINNFTNTLINFTYGTQANWMFNTFSTTTRTNLTNTTFANPNGSIRIVPNITIEGFYSINATDLNITNSTAYINSTRISTLNQSSQIILRGLTLTDPEATVDFEDDNTFIDCSASICTEDTYTGGAFTFNVTRWTAYRAQEFTLCGDTIISNTTLTQNYSCAGKGIEIGANDVTLDCNGFTITYDTAGLGKTYGVGALARSSPKVLNCRVTHGSFSGNDTQAMVFNNSNYTTVHNSTINLTGQFDVYGIYFNSLTNVPQNASITNTTINVSAIAQSAYGIYLRPQTHNFTIKDNHIWVAGNFSVEGIITIGDSVQRVFIQNNTIFANGTGTGTSIYGIDAGSITNGSIFNNTIIVESPGAATILNLISPSTNTTVDRNYMVARELSAAGQSFSISGPHNIIQNNIINVTGIQGGANPLSIGGFNDTFRNNSVYARGNSSSGVGIINGQNHTFVSNLFVAQGNGSDNYGISASFGAQFNTFANNTIYVFGISNNSAIRFEGINFAGLTSIGNYVTGGMLFTNGTESYGIEMANANNTIHNVTLNGTTAWMSTAQNMRANLSNITFATGNGSIRFNDTFNLTNYTAITQLKLNITNNNAFVNSTNLTALNTTAQITLQSISVGTTGAVSPAAPLTKRPTVDFTDSGTFSDCSTSICTNAVQSGTTYSFNVTRFTSYSSNDSYPAYINQNSTVTTNITVNTSAFIINASNIFLDCNGYVITYDSNGSGATAITATSLNNIAIKNCILIDGNSSGASGGSINFTFVTNSTILNNTLRANGTAALRTITLNNISHNNTIENNTVRVFAQNAIGIEIDNSSFNKILRNSIEVNVTNGASQGISFTIGNETIIANNTIRVDNIGGLTATAGIKPTGVNLSVIRNNTILINGVLGGERGIFITDTRASVFDHNNITVNGTQLAEGIRVQTVSANNTIHNNIITANATGVNAIGINMQQDSHSNNISNNTIRTFGTNENFGIGVINAYSVIVENNTVITNGTAGINYGIRLGNSAGQNNTVRNNYVETHGTRDNDGFVITLGTSRNTITNNTISAEGNFSLGFNISAAANNTINNTIISATEWILTSSANTNNTFSNITFQTTNGSIKVIGSFQLNGSFNVSQGFLNTTFNKAFLNGTNLSALNQSSQITLNNLTGPSLEPTVDFDTGTFTSCSSSRCTTINNSNATFIFNVTSWTSYSTQNSSTCPGTITANATFTANKTSAGNCVTFGADNIVLDCNGYVLIWDTGGTGSDGVSATTRNNITVKNCDMRDGNSGGAIGVGILFADVNNGYIFNNTIQTNGTNDNYAIDFTGSSSHNNLFNNTLRSRGTSASNIGFLMATGTGAINNTFDNNTILTNGTSGNIGLNVNNARHNRFLNNVIIANGTSTTNRGIVFSATQNNTVENNIIRTNGTSTNEGINTGGTSDKIFNNTIYAEGTTTNNRGISVTTSSTNNFIANNTIRTNGSTGNFGIYFFVADSNIMQDNSIISNGSGANNHGIVVETSLHNYFNRTNITASGSATSHGVQVINSAFNNTFNRTNIIARSPTSSGYTTSANANSTFDSTIFNFTTQWVDQATTNDNNTFRNTTFETPNGTIRIYNNFSISGVQIITQAKLNITFNQAKINTSNLSSLNTTAQITLKNLTGSNLEATVDFEDDGTYAVCDSSVCTIVNSANTTFIFNVTHFTNFSTQENPCPGTITANYTVTANITKSTTASCITLGADNISLDCNGYTLLGNGSGTGINATGRNNITVKNCVVTFFNENIFFSAITNSTAQNNTVINATAEGFELNTGTLSVVTILTARGNATGQSSLDITGGNNNTLTHLFVNGTTGPVFSINGGTRNNTIRNATVQATGTGMSVSGAYNNTIENVTASGNSNPAFSLTSADNNTINNTFATGGTQPGFSATSSNGNILTNIRATSGSVTGIELIGFNNTVQNTFASGTLGFTLGNGTGSGNNTLYNITASGTSSAGFFLSNTQNNTINTLTAASSSSVGLSVSTATNNTITNSSIGSNTVQTINIVNTALDNKINNTVIFSNLTWIATDSGSVGNKIFNVTFATGNGTIFIINATLAHNTSVNQTRLNISSNRAFMNATNLTTLNTTSQLILYNLTGSGLQAFIDPEDDGTYNICPSSRCTTINNGNTTFIVNVTGWTSYSGQNACPGTITENNTLIANITATLTNQQSCVNFAANNIVLDCNGYTITGNQSGLGVNASSRTNITIQNCIIKNFNRNIDIISTSTSRIHNTTVINATTNNIFLNTAANTNNLTYITAEANSTTHSLLIQSSSNVRVFNLTANIFSTTGSSGLYFFGTTDSILENYTGISLASGNTHVRMTSTATNNNITNVYAENGTTIELTASGLRNIIRNVLGVNSTISSTDQTNTFNNITLNTTGATTTLTVGRNNNFTNINVSSHGGIALTGAQNDVRIVNATLNATTSSEALRFTGSSSFFQNITAVSTSGIAINFVTGTTTNLTNFSATTISGTTALQLSSAANDNRITNGTITSIGATSDALTLSGVTNTFLANLTLQTRRSWIAAGSSLTNNTLYNVTFLNLNGSINLGNATVVSSVTYGQTVLNITSNSAFINTTARPELNTTAQITLNNLTGVDREPIADFEDDGTFVTCSGVCTEISYTGGIYIFNVTHFTNFSTQQVAVCGDTIAVNTTLSQNYTCNATFVTFGADNIGLNCDGYTVFWDSTGGGHDAIVANSRVGLNISNCIFRDSNASGVGGIGINFSNVNRSDITNVTIQTNGTTTNDGILLINNSHNNTIQNSTIYARGSSTPSSTSTNDAIELNTFAASNLIRNNNLDSFSGGLNVVTNSTHNNILNNRMDTGGTVGVGTLNAVYFENSANNMFNNNTVNITTATNHRAILILTGVLENSNNITISNNSINSTHSAASKTAIYESVIGGTQEDIKIIGNNINVNGTSAGSNDGIRGDASCGIKNIAHNIIRVNGTSTAVGIVTPCLAVHVNNNTITVYSPTTTHSGISLSNVGGNNIIANNTVFVNGTTTNDAISFAGSNNIVENNNITINATGTSNAVQFSTSSNNNLTRNNITMLGTGENFALNLNLNDDNNRINHTIIYYGQWIRQAAASTGNIYQNTTFATGNGSITIIPNVTLSSLQNVNTSGLNISFNQAGLNSTNLTQFNTTAQIILKNLTGTNLQPIVDFEDDGTFVFCSSSICTVINSSNTTFIFNVTRFTNYSTEQALACGDTITVNATLTGNLTGNFTNQQSCILFGANNITLDCNGYTLLGNGSGIGINATNRQNVTIKNCVITFFNQNVLFNNTNSSFIDNITASNASAENVYIFNSSANIISRVTSRANSTAGNSILLFLGYNNVLGNSTTTHNTSGVLSALSISGYNSTFINVTASGINIAYGIRMSNDNNTLRNVTATGTSNSGLLIADSARAVVNDTVISSNSNVGAVLQTISHSRFSNITVTSGGSALLYFLGGGNNTFANITATSASAVSSDAAIDIGSGNATFTNITATSNLSIDFRVSADNVTISGAALRTNGSWITTLSGAPATNFSEFTFFTANGSVLFRNQTLVPANQTLTSEHLNVTFNNAYINSSNASYLNQSAQVTLTGLTLPTAQIIYDFNDDSFFDPCPGVICTFISYTGGTALFNVSRWTSYKITIAGVNFTFTKTDNPDPLNVSNLTVLNYTVIVNVTDGVLHNATLNETYPLNTTFINASPAPTIGNNFWRIGNVTAQNNFTILIQVNVSDHFENGTVINNSVNMTYQNSSSATNTTNATANTTIINAGASDLIPVFLNASSFNPSELQNISLNATILNNGTAIASNFAAEFRAGNCTSGILITNFTGITLAGLTNITLNTTWIAQPPGPVNISVCADTTNIVTESDEFNNNLSMRLNVKAHADYYGNLTGNITLDTQANNTAYDWNFTQSGNVYFTDSDQTINFSRLIPIGKNTTGGNTSNDFADIDSVLNMTTFNDSVQTLWALDAGSAKQLRNFTVQGRLIQNVSVINATGSFYTGILWDSTYDSNGQYDTTEREPLVFIANVNRSKTGQFGLYDYEAHVPVLLRTYNSTTSLLAFYIELR